MKRLLTGFTLVALLLCTTEAANAQDNSIKGLFLGAGSGALFGQAIGRDTEATLLGTAIGGIAGYMIGNEMDKGTVSQVHKVYRPAQSYRPKMQEQRDYTDHPLPFAESSTDQICREAEILATVDGRPKKIVTTVCRENGRWSIPSGDGIDLAQTIIIDRTEYIAPSRVVFFRSPEYGFYRRHGKHHHRPNRFGKRRYRSRRW